MEKYKNKKLSPKERAEDLLSRMTLKEKVGQIAQPFKMFDEYTIEDGEILLSDHFKDFVKAHGGIGTVFSFFRADPWSQRNFTNGITRQLREKAYNTIQKYIIENSRLGIPALMEENAPHGLQVLDSVIYPTNLGIGATFDSRLTGEMAKCVAVECKNAGIHVPNSSLFDMACDPRFGRTEECFSEDPYLAAELSGAIVKGYKDSDTMICAKHYCAQGAAVGGHCGGKTNIGERELHEIHLPPVKSAVDNGVDFIMVTYNDLDGVRCHANRHVLRDILQEELKFDGVIRADRMGNDFKKDRVLCGAEALNAGVMLGLGDTAFARLEEAVALGYTSEAVIDDAVLRILTKKFESGVMDDPFIPEDGRSVKYLESGLPQEVAYKAAAESLVLLKNEQKLLPLRKPLKLALFGEHADSIYTILGDYTPPQKTENFKTIYGALKDVNPQTEYTKGWDFYGSEEDFGKAMDMAKEADAVVVCLGGSSSRDFFGVYNDKGQTVATRDIFMDCGEGRDVCDLTLPGNQLAFLKKLKETGKPIISVLLQGRTYLIDEVIKYADAVMVAWYPGQEGPRAIADTLFGKNNCFGRLPVSIPNSSSALPVCYNRRPMGVYCDLKVLSDFSFGSGLNYSDVKYSDLTVEKTYTAQEIANGAKIEVSITLENCSDMDVSEVVMLFIKAQENSIIRRISELKGFQRVDLKAGETKKISMYLGKKELEIFGLDNRFVVEPTNITLSAGGNIHNLLTAELVIT